MNKNTLLIGTIILTLSGFLTRIMGFFYKIYLSNTMTTENLGLYQLIFPVYGICFTLYASGIQTAISQLVANCSSSSKKNTVHQQKNILRCGIIVSVLIALFLSMLVFTWSDFIATRFLMDSRCSNSLRVISTVFPFCGMTACINGYYYGLKKTKIPASTQLFEQVIRIASVCFLAVSIGGEKQVSCELATFGIVLGEIASNIFSILSLLMDRHKQTSLSKKSAFKYSSSETIPSQKVFSETFSTQKTPSEKISSQKVHSKISTNKNTTQLEQSSLLSPFKQLTKLAVPLTANRLVISILHSFEAILVPFSLQKFGLSTEASLSLYGILSGMAIPFILFPSAITNALAVLLLPTISEAQAIGNKRKIQTISQITIKYSLIIGIFATFIFILFGNAIGNVFYHNTSAGYFIVILSWLCPFLYLSTTFSSIINGLGQTHLTFFNTIISLAIRIACICYLVPQQGINGYLISLLISQLALTLLDYLSITKTVSLPIDSINCIGKPVLILFVFGFFFSKLYEQLALLEIVMPLVLLLGICFLLCICYIGMLVLTKAIQLEELTIK